MVVARYSEAQRGTTHNATARLVRGGNKVTALLARGDNMAQRGGTRPKFAYLFPERGDQALGTTARPNCDTMAGSLRYIPSKYTCIY